MAYVQLSKDTDNIVTITLDDPDRSVNVMNARYIDEMEAVVSQLVAEVDTIAGIIIASGKRTFFAGGDLDELLSLKKDQAEEYGNTGLRIKAGMRQLETLGKPIVAAINGAALGGGFEICLACHHRVAIDQRAMKVGLPEVTLGLLPGAGGVVRLVRLLGLKKALPLLSEGGSFGANQALELGLIDSIASDTDDMLDRARAWIRVNPVSSQPWDKKDYQFPGGDIHSRAVRSFIPVANATLIAAKKNLYPAPQAILNCAVESMRVDFEGASRIESRYLANLAIGSVAKNMITHFFQMQKLQAGASRPLDIEKSSVATVGIIGAGMMGAGIAYCAAAAGINVVLKDVSQAQADKGKAYSEKILKGLIDRGRSDENKKAALLGRISATDKTEYLAACDLVIEAVFESQSLKEAVTKEAEQVLREGVLFTTNTSTLPISGLASAARDASNYIGLHFFSPVDKMKLVEIICGESTSDTALAKAYDFVKQIRKVPIVVNDSRSFYTSRVYEIFQNEGAWLLQDGVKPALIENLALQLGLPVGPLAANDEVAQRTIFEIKNAIRQGVEAEGKTYPADEPPYLWTRRMVEEWNRLGKASGAGYYDYPQGEKKRLWPALETLQPAAVNEVSYQDIQDRLMYCQCLEAVRCLEEGVLRSVVDCNIGSMLGLGFPQYTGGQLQYINSVGLSKFSQRAAELTQRYGSRFEPPALLLEMAASDRTFS